MFCLGFILFGTLWVSWTWIAISFLILGKFSTIISSIFSWPFFLSSSSGTPMIWMLGCLALPQRSLSLYSFLLILFLFSSLLHLFPSFYRLPHLAYLLPQLLYCWFPPECLWYQLLDYSLLIDSFLFSSRSLLNIFCIFSVLVSSLFICNSIFIQDFGSSILSLF